MAKQIKRSEIAEKDLYKEIRDSAEQTITQINLLNDSLVETATTIKSKLTAPLEATMKGLNEVNESTETMNKTMEASIKLDKAKAEAIDAQIKAELKLEKLKQEEIKTEEKLIKLMQQEARLEAQERKNAQALEKSQQRKNQLTQDEIKEKIRLQRVMAEQKKELTDQVILEDKEAGTLEKLSARSRVLRREREKLNLETEEGAKRLKEINEELDENNEVLKENSDKLKQQKLNVGNYTESIEQATGELGGMIKNVRDNIAVLKDQAKAFLATAKGADTAGKKVKLFGKALIASGIGAIIALLGGIISSMGDTREGVMTMQATFQKAMSAITIGFSKAYDGILKLILPMQKFALEVKDFFGIGDEAETLKKIEEIDKKLTEIDGKTYDVGASFKRIDEGIKLQFALEDAIAKTTTEIEKLRGQEELLAQQTGDMTLSFTDQLDAQEKYNKIVKDRITLEKDLAKQTENIKALEIQKQLADKGYQYTIQQVKALEFLDNQQARLKINSDTLRELTDAQVEQITKQNELNSLQAQNAMERRNTLKDLFEKELDYAIDAFDVQKTLNERLINDERTTLAERDALTEETRRLSDSAFKNQIKLVEDYTKQKIDFEALTKMTDEAEIRRTLKKNNLNETTLTRILEIIKERKIAEQDLADIERETMKKRQEMLTNIREAEQNIDMDNFDFKIETLEAQFQAEKDLRIKANAEQKNLGQKSVEELKKQLDEIKKAKIDQLKDQAEFEIFEIQNSIMEEEEKTAKIKEINSKLANDIKRIDQETLEEKKAIDEEEVKAEETKNEKIKELEAQRLQDQLAIIEALTNYSNELADKRIAKIDEEIEASQRRYDSFAELAQNGNILAQQSMAEEAKILAEQNRMRERMEKRKQKIQLASSVLQTYLTNSQDENVANPLQKTITDTILLTEFIKSLPTFLEGTEDTGKHGQGVDGKGGFNAILHPNERVLTKQQNALVGSMSNEELSQLAYNYQNGLVRDITDGSIVSSNVNGTSVLIDKLDSLEATIRNKPESNIELEQIIDGAMAITRSVKKGNTKIYNRYRV